MVLRAKHPVLEYIICHHRRLNRHVGTYQVLAEIRQCYWIVNAVSSIKRGLGKCHGCKSQSTKLGDQVTAPPTASHQGGVWERLVLTIRRILHSMIREHLVNEETNPKNIPSCGREDFEWKTNHTYLWRSARHPTKSSCCIETPVHSQKCLTNQIHWKPDGSTFIFLLHFPWFSLSRYFLIHVAFRDLLKDCMSIILSPPLA